MPSHSDGHGRGRGIVNILLSPCRRLRAGMQFHVAGRDMRAEFAMSGLILMAAVIVLLLVTRSGTENSRRRIMGMLVKVSLRSLMSDWVRRHPMSLIASSRSCCPGPADIGTNAA